jgi:hypothetical protein
MEILQPEELNLLQNKEIFLLKRSTGDKIAQIFGDCAENIRVVLESSAGLPEEVIASKPKISKGENYLGFPWTILDYPRVFGKPDTFALRTFCWWGNGFSMTLHLDGKYAASAKTKVLQSAHFLEREQCFLGINADPWVHHFGEDNYVPFTADKIQQLLDDENRSFLKIMRRLPLNQYQNLPRWCEDSAKILLNSVR